MKPDISLATCGMSFIRPILLLWWAMGASPSAAAVNAPMYAMPSARLVLCPVVQVENQTELTMKNVADVFGADLSGVPHSEESPPSGAPLRGESRLAMTPASLNPGKGVQLNAPTTAVENLKTLTPEILTPVIEQYLSEQLSRPGIRYHWKFIKEPRRISILPESSLKVIPNPDIRLRGAVVLQIGVYQQGLLERKVMTRLEIATTETLLVAAESIPLGTIITRNLIAAQLMETTRMAGEPCTDVESVLGYRACRTISGGRVITRDMVDIPYAVSRGDMVSIVAYGEGVTARVEGQARQNGRPGDWIWVTNLLTHDQMKAQVVDTKSVVIP
jgi:flagella basal body P-ring formation protein FlgA